MADDHREYWYDDDEPREGFEPESYDRPQIGRWVNYRSEPPRDPMESDPGHGWQQLIPRERGDRPRGIPRARPPADRRRHLGYGREVFYGDPYGNAGDRGRSFGELYGWRERDYAHRRGPLYREPWEWSHQEPQRAGYRLDDDVPHGRFSGRLEPGPHVGRGPRGYFRSDERILDEVADRLTRNGWVDASDIDVRVSEAEVVLEGTVPSRDVKHLVEDLAANVAGVRDVDNRLRVRRAGRREDAAPGEGNSGPPAA